MSDRAKILIGEIVAAQGLRGEFRVRTFTESPADFKNLNAGIRFVRSAGPNAAICGMDGVNDRAAAEKLRGTELFVDRADLPELKKGEHYVADLIGMRIAESSARVVFVHNFGAGDILELDNGEMIGFNGAVVDYEKKIIGWQSSRSGKRDKGK
ncbi:MAG: ribosome maturation factor RimM [Rickettsiales bacterium]|jgi:16S rRNA processing protein RimM|nr:ribosome maturation factor RimM [Rickettsiales bacterium]